MNIGIIIAAVLISFAIGVPVGIVYRKKVAESKINSAEQEAKKLVDMAKIEAENLKKICSEVFGESNFIGAIVLLPTPAVPL